MENIDPQNWKNKKGTGDRTKCNCGTWKNHWETFSRNNWPLKCGVLGCNNPAEHGGHIFKSGNPSEYILPMCASCNSNYDMIFTIKPGRVLVPANRGVTCGY